MTQKQLNPTTRGGNKHDCDAIVSVQDASKELALQGTAKPKLGEKMRKQQLTTQRDLLIKCFDTIILDGEEL